MLCSAGLPAWRGHLCEGWGKLKNAPKNRGMAGRKACATKTYGYFTGDIGFADLACAGVTADAWDRGGGAHRAGDAGRVRGETGIALPCPAAAGAERLDPGRM